MEDNSSLRALIVCGTRPEVIKLAPVIQRMRDSGRFKPTLVSTAQHRELAAQTLAAFDLVPDYDLGVMTADQDLSDLTAALLKACAPVIRQTRPTVTLVQGDTTTAFAGALAAFYCGVPVAHVEAGLRTGDPAAPFPEEASRSLIGRIAAHHFCPTEAARQNLLREGVDPCRIEVTGNTVIDALMDMPELVRSQPIDRWREPLRSAWRPVVEGRRIILVTCHRRESFGAPFEDICLGVRRIAWERPDVELIYPVHLNPNVRRPVFDILAGIRNVHLIDPLDYPSFVFLLSHAHLVVTDSGGVQEEAAAMGRPVLVVRQVTERHEIIDAGLGVLVGTGAERIAGEAIRLLDDEAAYRRMATGANPYGDGHAAERICASLLRHYAP